MGWGRGMLPMLKLQHCLAACVCVRASNSSTPLCLPACLPARLPARLSACHACPAEALPMLKLKDFPPTNDFRQVMARHHDDFVAMLTRRVRCCACCAVYVCLWVFCSDG